MPLGATEVEGGFNSTAPFFILVLNRKSKKNILGDRSPSFPIILNSSIKKKILGLFFREGGGVEE